MSLRRIFSSIGVNHIIIKGNNDLPVFLDNDDRRFFLNLLNSKIKDEFIIISYCLMSNHIHLLIKEKNENCVSTLMDSVLSYYSKIFNEKYNRKGALFKPRFFSENVENDFQFENTIRYIHNNPLKAKIVSDAGKYTWSSYREYETQNSKYCDIGYAEKYLGHNNFLKNNELYSFFDDDKEECYMKSYDYAAACVERYLNGKNIYDVLKLQVIEQEKLILYLRKECNINCATIAKITGISIDKVYKYTKNRTR